MQPLERDGLTAEQVRTVLLSDNLAVTPVCDLLDAALNVVQDLTPYLTGGSVTRQMYAEVHGTCALGLTTALSWGTALVRPGMRLSADGVDVRFNLGVFALLTPDDAAGESSATYSVQGQDRLYLLNRPVGADYSVPAGTGYLAAMRQVITDAGLSGVLLDGSAEDKTLPADKTWELIPDNSGTPTTWLRIFNDLAAAINYRGVWADSNGRFRSEPYVDATYRPVEFTFDMDPVRTILGRQRTRKQDLWKAPNRWVVIQQNRPDGAPAATEGDGRYTFTNDSDGPASVAARGLIWPKVLVVDAADQDSLVARAQTTIAADRRVDTQFRVTTGPFPAAGHFDVFAYSDDVFGSQKVQAVEWRLDLKGADMDWTWQAVA